MENLLTLIPEFLLIVIVVIYVFGAFLKGLKVVPDKYIVSILMLLGTTAAVLLNIINAQYKVSLDVIVNRILRVFYVGESL